MDRLFVCLLIDFYGGLLTPTQRRIMKLYYEDDLSLGEISERLGVSRQAVHYTLKRALSRLESMEGKLKLAKRFLEQRRSFENIRRELSSLMEDFPLEGRERLGRVIKRIDRILERGDLVV